MIKVLFIRHGATAGNLEKRYIGCTDEPLSETGIKQLRALPTFKSPDQLFVSPMLRTVQTADILFPNQPKTIIPNLREMDFGIFEGKTADELTANPMYQKWVDANCLLPIPNGEDTVQFKRRACDAFLNAMEIADNNQTIAFVVHGGIIMSILEAFALPKKNFYDYHLKNGGYVLYNFDKNHLTMRIY